MKMMWDDEHLYVAAGMIEPQVWATYDQRDMIVFQENDFEIFIDPDGDTRNYYEIEVNALGTIFDLFLPRTYIDRGKPDHDWNCPGMRWAVHVDGTLNDSSDIDHGWTGEFALPWSAFADLGGMPCPPRAGDTWRINFSRVQWTTEVVRGEYHKSRGLKEDNWVWSPQGVIDMHRPQRWGYVEFTTEITEGGGERQEVSGLDLGAAHWTIETHGDQSDVPANVRGRTFAARVPGCVHSDLIRAGVIGHPNIGDNEEWCQWIGRTDWRYRCRCEIDAESLTHERIDLVLDGLDTIAVIDINGHRVGEAMNMHHAHRFGCRQFLRRGENELIITLRGRSVMSKSRSGGLVRGR